ncbi:MAG TPA: BTAD domain-containing putative transcriptional regulator [Umezawaea sp.]|nr:BTAD domain-containing putative transcriptional regulator [Umezawaea sp.]
MQQGGSASPASVDVVLLGPVGVRRDGVLVSPPSALSRALLASLGLADGRAVGSDALADQVWGGREASRSKIAVAVHRLRRWLREETGDRISVRTGSSGYALELTAGTVDVGRFRALAAEAASLPPAASVRVAALALRLWRGRALEGLTSDLFTALAVDLDRERWAVVLRHAHAALRSGSPETAVAALRATPDDHPLDEGAHAVLIEALAAVGRQAEALQVYEDLRARLAESLGVDPGAALREAHLRVLRQEPPPKDRRDVVPAQLPAAVPAFTGRDEAVRALDEAVSGVLVIAGSAGVGKTALAVHWAHRVRHRFPDGQLFADLRGFDPAGTRERPKDVLVGFLRALGFDAADVPADVEEASALFRSRLSGRRVLLLLDNASNAADVRTLLPGSSTCLVVVTSRDDLGGLIAHQGARLVELAVFSPANSLLLLRKTIAREPSDVDSEALALLAERCAHLPLALRLAAAHLTTHPHRSVADYADRLAAGGVLSVLDRATGEHDAISTAFRSSYTALSANARTLFRALGHVPGNDVSLPAAAAILGADPAEARAVLDELRAAHLVAEHLPDRFTTHDLLRAYAAGRAQDEDSADTLADRARRLFDFYADTAHGAAPLLREVRRRVVIDVVHPVRFTDREAALRWHDQERDALIGVIDLARRHGWHEPVWRLVDTLYAYFTQRRRWPEWFTAYRMGLASAEHLDDRRAAATMHLGLGVAHKQTGAHALARSHYLAALSLAEAVGDDRLTTSCRLNLGGLCVTEGDPASGIEYLRAALPAVEGGEQRHVAVALHINLGCALLDLDDLAGARDVLTKALDTALLIDDVQRVCYAHHNLAEVALRRGSAADAEHHANAELRYARRCGDPVRQAAAFDLLGSAVAVTDRRRARHLWSEARDRYAALHHRAAAPIAAWLDALDGVDDAALPAADRLRRQEIRGLH